MDASECRRQAALCIDEAQSEADMGIRTILLGMARNWMALAHQFDRLIELRADPDKA